MAEPKAQGSIIFKLIIVILIGVVLAAILIPQREWKKQADEQQLCRLHQENLYYSSLQYLKKFKRYQANLDTLLSFVDNDSLLVPQGLFEIERLTIWESPRDSFLVGFPDDYHYNKLDWRYTAPDTLIMNLVTKERCSGIPLSEMVFSSSDSIFVEYRGKGENDTWVTVWGNSLINYYRVPADSAFVPTKYFAISEDPEDFRNCPSCGMPYKITTNVNLKIQGVVTYTVLRKDGGNVSGNEFLSNIFIKKLRSDAAVEALNMFKADTTIFVAMQKAAAIMIFGETYADSAGLSPEDSSKIDVVRDSLITAMKDSMLIANFNRNYSALKRGSKTILDEEATIMMTVDSIAAWDDTMRIKNRLYNAELNTEEKELSATVDIESMLLRLNAEERYFVARTDSVGLTIACPIESTYLDPDRSLFLKIFGVGPVANHGQVRNGDYSWSEKK